MAGAIQQLKKHYIIAPVQNSRRIKEIIGKIGLENVIENATAFSASLEEKAEGVEIYLIPLSNKAIIKGFDLKIYGGELLTPLQGENRINYASTEYGNVLVKIAKPFQENKSDISSDAYQPS